MPSLPSLPSEESSISNKRKNKKNLVKKRNYREYKEDSDLQKHSMECIEESLELDDVSEELEGHLGFANELDEKTVDVLFMENELA